jgi:hypothetical protein
VSDSNATITSVEADETALMVAGPLHIYTCSLEVRMDDDRRVRIEGQPYVMELALAQRVRIDIDLEVAS